MLGYRKRSFANAHALLQNLSADPGDLGSLRDLQKLLLREIVRAEKGIRSLKGELKGFRGDKPTAKRVAYLTKRIEGLRQCAYIWRCFGDAVAFLYLDKYALKQCFYSTHNTNPKQAAGFIVGKDGLATEIAFLEYALENKVPALLTDLTNTIRYGDVCLLGNSDPSLIEVKASKALDSRGKKQKRALEQLHSFLETDAAEGLRGLPGKVRRHAAELPERAYVDEFNSAIQTAIDAGHAICRPEPGIYYVVMASGAPPIATVLDSLGLKRPWPFMLNASKNERAWAPYQPFTLSIRNEEHLWKFIRGDIFIVVLLEIDRLAEIASNNGFDAKFDSKDELYPLRLERTGTGHVTAISAHLLTRIAMEFVSPEWIILSTIEGINRYGSDAEAEIWGVKDHNQRQRRARQGD